MKLSILFFAILGISAAAALPSGKVLDRSTRSLDDDLEAFAILMPVDEILEIAIQYLAIDEEVQKGMEYLTSDDFKKLILTVEDLPEYIDLVNFLEEHGLKAGNAINALHSLLGLSDFVIPTKTIARSVSTRITGGLRGLIDDIKKILPIEALRALHEEKRQTSPDYVALVTMIGSEPFLSAVAKVKATPEYQALREKALAVGIDVEYVSKVLFELLGLNEYAATKSIRVTSSLNDDLNDFIDLVHVDEIFVLVIQYLSEDSEFQAAVEYLTSYEFISLLEKVEAMPQYHKLVNFLADGGLEVVPAINSLHSLLGLGPFVPSAKTISRSASTRITGGLKGLIADIKAHIDIEAVRALHEEKRQTSPDYAALVELLASNEFMAAVAEVKATEQYQALRAKALAIGIDVESVSDLLLTLLGLA